MFRRFGMKLMLWFFKLKLKIENYPYWIECPECGSCAIAPRDDVYWFCMRCKYVFKIRKKEAE